MHRVVRPVPTPALRPRSRPATPARRLPPGPCRAGQWRAVGLASCGVRRPPGRACARGAAGPGVLRSLCCETELGRVVLLRAPFDSHALARRLLGPRRPLDGPRRAPAPLAARSRGVSRLAGGVFAPAEGGGRPRAARRGAVRGAAERTHPRSHARCLVDLCRPSLAPRGAPRGRRAAHATWFPVRNLIFRLLFAQSDLPDPLLCRPCAGSSEGIFCAQRAPPDRSLDLSWRAGPRRPLYQYCNRPVALIAPSGGFDCVKLSTVWGELWI
ncbi:MAG: hypothetical protein J3K34DRAFT_216232 [Monoraphidium minutum]|nr:MAG: hypothetical protein J3K34DRAFT_216232 [Monoraphidium minutum]